MRRDSHTTAFAIFLAIALPSASSIAQTTLDDILGEPAPRSNGQTRPEATQTPLGSGKWLPRPWDGGSISMGSVNEGYLIDGHALPAEGDGWRVLDVVPERGTFFGTDELVAAIQRAAQAVQERYPGPRLVVGNLSVRRGGPIKYSVSHRAGRDADLLFYQRTIVPAPSDDAAPPATASGEGDPVEPDDFTVFQCDGTSEDGQRRFDVERNWALVESLLTNETIEVQLIFVSICLKRQLIAQAKSVGAAPELIARARQVLWRPTDSTAHRDHFHVRLYCSLDDLAAGCEDSGHFWDWASVTPTVRVERARALAKTLRSDDPAARREAAKTIGAEGLRLVARALVRALDDPDAGVRRAAHEALVILDEEESYGALASHMREPTTLIRMERALATLARLHSRGSAWRLEEILAGTYDPLEALHPDATTRRRMRLLAAQGLAEVGRYRSFQPLISALDDPDEPLRTAALHALRRLTNQRAAADADSPASRVSQWRSWWRRNHRGKLGGWLASGFRSAGFRVKRRAWDWDAVPRLLDAVGGEAEIGWNAQQLLCRIAGEGAPPYHPDKGVRHERWQAWWWGGHRWRANRHARKR